MRMIIGRDYDDMSRCAAEQVAQYIHHHPGALLTFAAGKTPMGTFEWLIGMQREGVVDLSSVFYAGLDEWVGLGYEDSGSCQQVMMDGYYTPAGISPERIHVFDGLDAEIGKQCAKMEAWIADHGGIGLAMLGIGMNGHVGFNEPDAPQGKGCFTVALDGITKAVSRKYFGKTTDARYGITIGIETLKDACEMIILASGEDKADIVQRAFSQPMTRRVPASLLQDQKNLTLLFDEKAASKI